MRMTLYTNHFWPPDDVSLFVFINEFGAVKLPHLRTVFSMKLNTFGRNRVESFMRAYSRRRQAHTQT